MTVSEAIKSLVKYGIREGLLDALDEVWAVNRILEIMNMDSIDAAAQADSSSALEDILKVLLDDAQNVLRQRPRLTLVTGADPVLDILRQVGVCVNAKLLHCRSNVLGKNFSHTRILCFLLDPPILCPADNFVAVCARKGRASLPIS